MPAKPADYWNDSLTLGVPAIDDQHRGLFKLAYELDCAVDAGDDEIIGQVLDRLKEYCQSHFIAEERLMHDYAYPGFHAHMMLHDEFTQTVIEFESQRDTGRPALAQQIASFLRRWLSEHIAVEDKKLAALIKAPVSESQAELAGLPVFVEAESTASQSNSSICTQASALALKQGLPFVGFAHTIEQARQAVEMIKSMKYNPAVFVINTYGAKGMLAELDALMGEVPVLFLRRGLFAGRSGLMDQVNLQAYGAITATLALGRMKPRLTSMWFYGATNCNVVAARTAEAVIAFLRSNDFRQVERLMPAG
ncbi:MAG TPA: bacteriohemerythrin [Planctomycetota bacterium]|jgi:hemerythrin